jgi:hypothetical protein
MSRLRFAIFACVLCTALALPAFAAQKKATPSKKKAPQQPVEVTQPPPPPPTPEQMPAVQPRVSYQNGLLSIDAPNSSMTDVLNAVKRQTGANIEVPAGASGDRIVARLGPGKPKDVLASLLSGSRFNFIILGPPQNPDAVQRVILTRRQNGSTGSAPAQQSMNPQVVPAPSSDDDAEAPEEIEPDTPEEAPQPEATAPTMQPGQEPAQQQQGQGQEQNPNQPKTPEQLLQELQRMQQQQQQGQQQEQNQNQNQQQQEQNQNQQQPNPQQQMPPDRNPEDQ